MNIQHFLIDSRQPPAFRHIIENAFPRSVVTNLGEHSGDLLIQLEQKTIAIEVKEVPNDFLASVTDRRIFRQAEGIRYITPWAFLLLSHDFEYDSTHRVMGRSAVGYGPLGTWNRDHVEGVLTAIQARGVIVRTAYKGYIDAITRIVNWVETADAGAVTTDPIKLSPFDKDDQLAVNLLSWFDGIGVTQAKNFLSWANRYGKLKRHELLELAITPFPDSDKPAGWTNHTIKRNRQQLEYAEPVPVRTKWLEEIDL